MANGVCVLCGKTETDHDDAACSFGFTPDASSGHEVALCTDCENDYPPARCHRAAQDVGIMVPVELVELKDTIIKKLIAEKEAAEERSRLLNGAYSAWADRQYKNGCQPDPWKFAEFVRQAMIEPGA